ncbi:UvrD-helicase domain-containing protein [Pseudomonas oryzihabitans]|uniref:UvrD-helicase domain-containing protein n=1 Tax=Pseudomonas oryzihabitans TaxID=47885 RepID=UPI00289572AC|nr:UvrD-helicase domain-containing protein [Pseudomonas oryzihabitans]MDT3720813.1 UvrD-helicase domain-containing protein [Pseudomonas oryzihabitans]
MTSILARYRQRLAKTLGDWFPRTTLFLKGEPVPSNRKKPPSAKAKRPSADLQAVKPNKKAVAGHGHSSLPASAPQSAPIGIYGPPLQVKRSQEQRMKAQVERAVAQGIVQPPSTEQWKMILARAPATRIFAGAGSGKTTTLVLRVVFMLCHLEIPREQLTVISFTKTSCEELRTQLKRVLAFWDAPLDDEGARELVRTFHSALAQLARAELRVTQWFEQLSPNARPDEEPDNALLTGATLNDSQRQLLLQAYEDCYKEDAGFRRRTHLLLELAAPDEEAPPAAAPLQPFVLNGERQPQALPDLFYAQASFAETLGMRVGSLRSSQLECSTRDRIFLEAMQQFWRHFNKLLKEQRLITFNTAFAVLTDRLEKKPSRALIGRLEPFTHLLIDEFQDISPQIALWLQQVQRRLADEKVAPSLMAIGDDWQSIYGWRGSSPELFIHFDRWFPGQTPSQTLMLGTNYRSSPQIVADGERILAQVRHKQDKRTQAFRPATDQGHGVKIIPQFDISRQLPLLLGEIEAQRGYAAECERPERCAVMVMSRVNAPLKILNEQLGRQPGVRTCTIHRAKGLQAEVAIVLDDGQPQQPHPLRNALYAASGHFQQSYDEAMADEALRLSYVAVTRGVSRVLWYTRQPRGAAAILAG